MADQPLHLRSDAELESALRDLSDAIAWPDARPDAGGRDIASAVRQRIESSPRQRRGWTWRPARRALVLAVVILLALAAVAAATGFGLPGLRLIFGPAPAAVSPPPSLSPSRSPAAVPGASMDLGRPVDLVDLDAEAGFAVRWPADPAIGPPDAAYIDDRKEGQVTLVWGSRPGLPDTLEPGVGLLMSSFRGEVNSGTISKIVSIGSTARLVVVDGDRGWWVSGDPHFFFYEGPNGAVVDERRWIGDVLLWSDGAITHRLETSLGQDRAIEIAESMP